jgi:thiol-disulfide isomerase/thioredoxin
LLAAGCDVDKKDIAAPPSTNRSNAVVVPSSKVAATPTAPATTAGVGTAAPSGPPRKLCDGQSQRPPPKGSISTAAAPGVEALPSSIPMGVGKWVWVNLWAAWCGPCKEEMPRLIAWQKKLSASGVLLDLAFVSIDDDERQLKRFIEGQPAGGVRSSYWLPEGTGRGTWLGALGLKEAPDLPAHALIAPSGQVACVIQGAVEERDYPAVAAFLGSQK